MTCLIVLFSDYLQFYDSWKIDIILADNNNNNIIFI